MLNYKIKVLDGLEADEVLSLHRIECLTEDEAVFVSAIEFASAKEILEIAGKLQTKANKGV